MFARRNHSPAQTGLLKRLILCPAQQKTADRLIQALERALQIAQPELPGLGLAVPMAEGYFGPAEIHVVWIFDSHKHLSDAIRRGGSGLLYRLTAITLREACMQVDGVEVNVHFDTEEERHLDGHSTWRSRLETRHYPARELLPAVATGQSTVRLVRKPVI